LARTHADHAAFSEERFRLDDVRSKHLQVHGRALLFAAEYLLECHSVRRHRCFRFFFATCSAAFADATRGLRSMRLGGRRWHEQRVQLCRGEARKLFELLGREGEGGAHDALLIRHMSQRVRRFFTS
jgi:hypothetical protein